MSKNVIILNMYLDDKNYPQQRMVLGHRERVLPLIEYERTVHEALPT